MGSVLAVGFVVDKVVAAGDDFCDHFFESADWDPGLGVQEISDEESFGIPVPTINRLEKCVCGAARIIRSCDLAN